MEFKLAILTVLATRPDGRATLDELTGEVEALTADADQDGDISSDLGDIFQSGLVIPDDDGLRITDAGRSVLQALKDDVSIDLPSASASQSLRRIDDLIGTEERQKIFDLELRKDEVEADPEAAETGAVSPAYAPPRKRETAADLPPEAISRVAPHERGDSHLQRRLPIAVVAAEPRRTDAPTVRVRDGHDSPTHAPEREAPRRSRFSGLIAAKLRQIASIWRRHLERDAPKSIAGKRTRSVGGGVIALLTLLVLVIGAGGVIAFAQIKSLKSEIVTLQRELSPLRERAARTEFLEKAKQNADQQKEAQIKSAAEKQAGANPRTEQAALNLTPEEIRLIRDFIKPSPAAGTPAPAINIGDPVTIATIPLPSPLMEKIPKLLGARFTTRNGSIIIVRRDSRQADAVLPPN